MKVLVLTLHWPWPLDSGGNVAQFGWMDYLRHRHEITLLIPAHTPGQLQIADQLRQLWPQVNVLAVHPPPPPVHKDPFAVRVRKRLKARVKEVYYALNPRTETEVPPIGSERLAALPEFLVTAAAAEARRGYDLIQVEHVEMLSMIHALPPGVPNLFLHHEIHYVVRERARTAASRASAYENYLYAGEKARELDTLRRYDMILTVSEHDRQTLQAELPECEVNASPFAYVAAPGQVDGFQAAAFAQRIVYVGGSRHAPNLDAVAWFVETMWPALSARCPALTFHVVGDWPPEHRARFAAVPGVVFTGFVEDIAAALRGSIMVVPLRVGSGIRAKILMAMTLGVPVVTTRVGVEGIDAENGHAVLCEDDPARFVEAVARLSLDQPAAASLARNAHDFVQRQFSPEAAGARRDEIYRLFQARRPREARATPAPAMGAAR